jgi:hypothetical protein
MPGLPKEWHKALNLFLGTWAIMFSGGKRLLTDTSNAAGIF